MSEKEFMLEALRLAEKGRGKVEPNPVVGAVVVKRKKIIGRGFHKRFGGKHAEVNALEDAGKNAGGAELFVTLEPCSHYGKTPPCTKAIIEAGIKKVFVAMRDPNPVSGNGIAELRKNGIEVETGLCKNEAKKQNECYITKCCLPKRPAITVKIALTTEGIIAFGDGKAKKITGKEAFAFTQNLRAKSSAIMAGVNTIIRDNPRLDVRKGRITPLRVIIDSKARTPKKARVFKGKGETFVFCTKKAPKKNIEALAKKGIVVVAKEKKGKVDLRDVFEKSALLGIKGVLVEPGNRLATSLLEEGLWDRLILIFSEKRIKKGMKAFGLKKEARARIVKAKKLGKDFMVEMVKA